MTKSSSKSEDEERLKSAPDRVTRTHGGDLVEAISTDDLELMNEPDCKHEKLVRDASETEFNAFVCTNPDCGVVVLFDKA